MFSNAFQFINRIRTELCDIAAQASHYKGWSDEFARKEIKNVVLNTEDTFRRKLDVILTEEHLQELSEAELNILGFREWSAKTPGLWLIPLYLKAYLNPLMLVTTIQGRTLAVDDADTDTRQGVCAWGFYHQKSKEARNG